ncbi:hypothetical protein [Acrocarpospora sp. B8E8]|uniref:hypothetical protein n=1 Tax=Acrocarpospora sp. B8E8 TaxID=3153572 RepID=UPI00325E9BA5
MAATATPPTALELLALMAALVADLDGQHRSEQAAYERGYRDGHQTGWDTGHAHAHEELAASWRVLAAHIRNHASTPTHTALETVRWDGRREDFGKPRPSDYRAARSSPHTPGDAPREPLPATAAAESVALT